MFLWLEWFLNLWLLVLPGWALYRAWVSVGGSSLRHALIWFGASSCAWFLARIAHVLAWPDRPWVYLAVCLTACGGIAILGARRPGMVAWNFVVGGLLLILLFPLIQQPWNDADWRLDGLHAAFLAMLLTAVMGNYLPAGSGHFWLPLGCSTGLALWWLWRREEAERWLPMLSGGGAQTLAGCVHFWAYFTWSNPGDVGESFAQRWRRFRHQFGLVWAARVLEQFNAAAMNGGLSVRLEWRGLPNEKVSQDDLNKATQLLETLLRKFTEGESAQKKIER